jgi:hypothetical protein
MARPHFTSIDRWTRAANYGNKPPFAYLREKLPDFDGEKRFSVYTGHAEIRDRLWVAWFLTHQQAVLWLEWNAVEMMAATKASGDEARALVRELQAKPNGFLKRNTGRTTAR